ncbi:MAG: hypothetical protein KKC26_03430, partial [Nanoarchaeota archaeon]|nr:hypothetical protein [Nanoarchaeota archaeon]
MKDLELLVTLWPSFLHFEEFAKDDRLAGIRLNTAMVKSFELDDEFKKANDIKGTVPLWFDIKGTQLRITEVYPTKDHLELTLNHPIDVQTPSGVLFKAGADYAMLKEVVDGNHLIFDGGPEYMVYEGESLHIRHPSLEVKGPIFLDYEIEKIEKAKKAGFTKFFLSYAESKKAIDEFRSYVGKESEIIAKIENKKGLEYVASEFKPEPNLSLMAARGDLYVEVDKPHHMLDALKLIVQKDPRAYVGSRILLSIINQPVPSCADLSDVAWLYDIGYKRMLLCDELCLKGDLLGVAVNVFD